MTAPTPKPTGSVWNWWNILTPIPSAIGKLLGIDVSNPVTAAEGVAGGLAGAAGVDISSPLAAASLLTHKAFWVRAGVVAAGVGMIVFALAKMTGADSAVVNVVGKVTDTVAGAV